MFNLKADNSFEKAYSNTAIARNHQLASSKAFKEFPKLIFVDINQKQKAVTSSLMSSFTMLPVRDFIDDCEPGSINRNFFIVSAAITGILIFIGKNV
jgi:hypothetical protein